MIRVTALASALAVAFFSNAAIASADQTSGCAAPDVVDVYSAVYGADSKAEALDVYSPDGARGEPLIVFVHGGAWVHGDKSDYEELARSFAACGFAFAVVNYKLAPAVRADAQAAEVAMAIKWLRDRSGADSFANNRIFLMGHSSGAELIAFVVAGANGVLAHAGLAQRDIAGVIAMDGAGYDPYRRTSGIGFHPLRLFAFTAAFGSDPSKWEPFDVRQYLTGLEPPFLVLHGTKDVIAPEYESTEFVDELRLVGDSVTYLQLAGRDHFSVLSGMTNGFDDPVFVAVAEFVGERSL